MGRDPAILAADCRRGHLGVPGIAGHTPVASAKPWCRVTARPYSRISAIDDKILVILLLPERRYLC